MPEPTLLASTGDDRADALLRGTVARFEAAFPARVRGYYLLGSYADATGLPTSDLDVEIVFRDGFLDQAERARAEELRGRCAAAATVEYDLELRDEASLQAGLSPTLKLGSLLVYGADIRDAFPLVPLDVWTRDRMHTSYWRLVNLFDRPLPVTIPMAYPDPAGAFYGYDRRQTRLPDGTQAPGTRDLIRSVGWAATALLALQAGQYVARKRDCHRLYREHIGDRWSSLLEALYLRCRGAWRCLIPADPAERRTLRAICKRTLGFERHFLAVYRAYLLSELSAAPSVGRLQAVKVLRRVPLADASVAAALRALAAGHDEPLRQGAEDALTALAAPARPIGPTARSEVVEKTRQDLSDAGDSEV